MKKRFAFLLIFILLLSCIPCTVGAADEVVLRVYNWQEYIDDGTDENGMKVSPSVMDDWAEDYYARTGIRVRVQYDTFETNETMLNTLKTGKSMKVVANMSVTNPKKARSMKLPMAPPSRSAMETLASFSGK